MERYMVHIDNEKYSPKDARSVLRKARLLCSTMAAKIRVARISSKYIELDTSVESRYLNNLAKRLEPIGKFNHARHVTEEEIEKDDGIKDGIFYFNEERFWEAHEAFEGVWKKCTGDEKELVQGVILVAVAFAHTQKNDDNICFGMMGRALEKLQNASGMYHNIDIDRIKRKAAEIRDSQNIVLFTI